MANHDDVPEPPVKPLPEECCGSGCVPCIFDYYYDQLQVWEAKYGPAEENENTVGSKS